MITRGMNSTILSFDFYHRLLLTIPMVALPVVLTSCDDGAKGDTAGTAETTSDATGTETTGNDETGGDTGGKDGIEFVESVLPSVSRAAEDCGGTEPATTLTMCDWINVFDAMVVGRVVSVTGVDEPVYFPQHPRDPGTRLCQTKVARGLEIEIEVMHTLHGETGASLRVRIGAFTAEGMIPMWYTDRETGESGWWKSNPDGTGIERLTEGEPFARGSVIGVLANRVPGASYYSAYDEPIFTFRENGEVVLTPYSRECDFVRPTRLSSLITFEELESEARGCAEPSDVAKQYRGRLGKAMEDRAEFTHAATCLDPSGTVYPEDSAVTE